MALINSTDKLYKAGTLGTIQAQLSIDKIMFQAWQSYWQGVFQTVVKKLQIATDSVMLRDMFSPEEKSV